MNDVVYEPPNPKPFADRHIAKVAAKLTRIPPGMANLDGKWSVARKTVKLGSYSKRH